MTSESKGHFGPVPAVSILLSCVQATGKMNPGRDDKVEFMMALDSCLTGPLSLKMFYFYRHLLQHGPPNGIPTLHQNIFYVEVQKFKVSLHACANALTYSQV